MNINFEEIMKKQIERIVSDEIDKLIKLKIRRKRMLTLPIKKNGLI